MKKLEPLFDVLGEILAVALVVIYVVLLANANWNFITNETALKVLGIIKEFGALALVAIVGIEAMCKTNFILRIIFYALLAIIVIFLFFPDTYNNLIGLVK